jgi:hypothetical protein
MQSKRQSGRRGLLRGNWRRKFMQIIKSVETRLMPIAPMRLNGVVAHNLNFFEVIHARHKHFQFVG